MSCLDHDANWFLAQFKPNSHHIAQRNLLRQGFETFLPLQEETRRLRGRFLTQLRPLFPGYLFVSLSVAQGGWRVVNSTYGISRLVSLGQEPTAVPRDLIDQLRIRCDEEGRLLPPKQLQPGDEVILTKGPFTIFVATIARIAPDQRIWVLMELMGRQTRIAVDGDDLRQTA
ncbi:MAG: transcriptional activator RfaH [Roseinatronobacter sp.]|nr:transcriptional activator RfaH [Roseinatronobacter sp.]